MYVTTAHLRSLVSSSAQFFLMKPLLELDCAAILRYMSLASSSEMALSEGNAPARLSVLRDSSISWLTSLSYLKEAVAYYFPIKSY